MEELTERQKEILNFLKAYVRDHGYPPTMREIGEHFGGRDHSTVIHEFGKIDSDVKKNQNVKNLIQKLMLDIKS